MCTVTILRDDVRGLILTMNRDEAKSRGGERPPEKFDRDVVACYPIDGSSGGTWVGANDQGLVLAILNRYQNCSLTNTENKKSRGLIIPEGLSYGNLNAAISWLEDEFDAEEFSPFTIILADRVKTLLYAWDGKDFYQEVTDDGVWFMYTSSSVDTENVIKWRRKHFYLWQKSGSDFSGKLPYFHLSQPENNISWAPMVERSNTHTKSITQVTVGDESSINYWSCPVSNTRASDLSISF